MQGFSEFFKEEWVNKYVFFGRGDDHFVFFGREKIPPCCLRCFLFEGLRWVVHSHSENRLDVGSMKLTCALWGMFFCISI